MASTVVEAIESPDRSVTIDPPSGVGRVALTGGTPAWNTTVQTADYQAQVNDLVVVAQTGVTVTTPVSPSEGDRFAVYTSQSDSTVIAGWFGMGLAAGSFAVFRYTPITAMATIWVLESFGSGPSFVSVGALGNRVVTIDGITTLTRTELDDGSGNMGVYGTLTVLANTTSGSPAISPQGDVVFLSNGDIPATAFGPVIADQTDGHAYRIISTAGVLSTKLVT
jgi:hypothetical protein